MFPFYNPWKLETSENQMFSVGIETSENQMFSVGIETSENQMFSVGIEREHWLEMGWWEKKRFQQSRNHAMSVSVLFLHWLLTHFMSLVSFNTPWKHQKTFGFLFSEGIERDQYHEMG